MKPDHFRIRIDRNTGDLWLTMEKPRQPMKRIAKMTDHILLALCADLFAEDGTKAIERDIKFSDGTAVRLTVSDITDPVQAGAA